MTKKNLQARKVKFQRMFIQKKKNVYTMVFYFYNKNGKKPQFRHSW